MAVPADYPGTFLDFKAELTEKLIAQGMDPSDFRITNTATKIDTTDQSTWVVYDHYYDQARYNSLGYTADQQKTHPFRAADNTKTTGGVIPMSDIFGGGGTTNKCRNFITHTYSYEQDGKANMVFAGYGTKPLVDYMFYPATSNARRTVSFDLDASVIDKHTLQGAGFLLNAAVDNNGILQGYVFYIIPRGSGTNIQQTADAYIYKLNNFNAMSTTSVGGTSLGSTTIDLGAAKKLRISIDLQETKVTVQSQPYDSAGNLIGLTPTNNFVNIPLEKNGYNGFGPIVGYTSHGCSSLTVFKYLDLEMAFESSAFDSLKTVQYYQGAEQKYFINLVGDKGDTGIPDPTDTSVGEEQFETNKKMFEDGINRMTENKTFYLSNMDDGHVLQNTDKESGVQGLGTSNGFIASGDSHVDLMAQYIYQNFLEGAQFQPEPVLSSIPLANFFLKDNTTDKQLMTVHLQHLTGDTVSAKIEGGSIAGTSAGDDGWVKWRCLTVTDPSGKEVYNSGWVAASDKNDPTKELNADLVSKFHFTKDSDPGRYEFHLQVRDDKYETAEDAEKDALHQSDIFTTYITAFNDTDYPIIAGANTHENTATITLTDTGQGIDEDGITFVEGNRGSGVVAYYVTNQPPEKDSPIKDPDKWIRLPYAQHSVSFDYVMTSTDKLYVWSMDECGNVGYKGGEHEADQPEEPAVFQPTRVVVEDPNGDVIKEYYVIGDKPIIVLPPDEEVPDHPDDPENEHFSGWQTPDGVDVTPGDETGKDTPIKPDDENTIVIRPSYSHDTANLVYLANGGKITTSTGAQVDYSPYQVVSGSSILKKIEDHNVSVSQKGYAFTGWKLYKTATIGVKAPGDAEYDAIIAGIGTASNLSDVTTQIAKKDVKMDGDKPADPEVILQDTYYLVAQWAPGNYTVRMNANGGSLKGASKVENVSYNTNLTLDNITNNTTPQGLPVSGRQLPTRDGYNFAGWSLQQVEPINSNDPDKATKFSSVLFKSVTGYTAGVAAPTMPDEDITVYAVWERDTSKMLINFDANGGSAVASVSYTAAEKTYKAPLKSNLQGYDFGGWYLKQLDGDGNQVFDDANLYPETGTTIDKSNGDLTYVAKWIPKETTKYTIDYFVNSGNKDDNGNYIYTKVNGAKQSFDSERVEDETAPGVFRPYTLTKYAPTESHVAIDTSNADMYLPEVTSGGIDYWLDTTNVHNVLEADVLGNGSTSLRLYYNRYLNINASKSNYSTGNGTVTPALRQKEGTTPTVTWAPDANSYVSRVTVNGVVRDDLLNAGAYTPAQGITSNEVVVVEFTKKDSDNPNPPVNPDDPDNPNPPVDPDDPDNPNPPVTPDPEPDPDPDDEPVDPRTFVVRTAIHGCSKQCTIEEAHDCTHECQVTGTKIYKAGKDAVVDWSICESSNLLRVELDGKPYDLEKGQTSLMLQGLAKDHTVDVYVTPTTKPSIGAERENGFYTITVNRYGGDGKFFTSSTTKIPVDEYAKMSNDQRKEAWTFEWDRQDSDYRIYNIRVNGNRQKDLPVMIPDAGSFQMSPGAGYIVDVYFYDIVETPKNPNDPVDPDDPDDPSDDPQIEYKEPDLSRVDEWVSVKTTILGGAGTIDPSFVAKKEDVGETHDVTYTLENSTDKDALDYVYYEVQDVTVNGKQVTDYETVTDGGKITIPLKLDGAVKDNDVIVKVKPLFVEVETTKVTLEEDTENPGNAKLAATNDGGTISASRTVGKYGNYYNIQAKPNPGFRLHAIEVTDDASGEKATYYAVGNKEGTTIDSFTTENPVPSQPTTQSDEPESNSDEGAEPQASVGTMEAAPAEAAAAADTVSDATIVSTTAEASVYMMGTLHPDNTFAPSSQPADQPEAEEPAADEGAQAVADGAESGAASEQGSEGDVAAAGEPAAADEPVAFAAESVEMVAPVSDQAVDAEGLVEGFALFEAEKAYADEADASEPAQDAFHVPTVVTAGSNTVQLGYGNMSADKHVNAIFVKNTVEQDEPTINDVIDDINDPESPTVHNVTLSYNFEPSYIDGSTVARPVPTNADGSLADDGTGKVGDNGSATVRWGIPENYIVKSVTVNGAPVSPAEAGKLDLTGITGDQNVVVTLERQTRNQPDSVPPTGFEQKFEVITDVSGYGGVSITPSNKLLEEGATYNVSWVPDEAEEGVDGKPINIPFIQWVKIDGELHPELAGANPTAHSWKFENIDGNHTVEVHTIMLNEDVDDDGIPDYNIDDDGDGIPETNIDGDGDGLPDTNVDTDGDGKPDVNIVDEDEDGEPDPVDPSDPKKPNVNIVDKDMDGDPENVDPKKPTEEQPKPNVNVDTDGDGKPDVNVDTDGDGKPDVNVVDKDGDGKPDPVDPKDPEAPKPTVNVDTDGDGEPDLFIDVDGDYIPDVNIDTDGDGKPDINVDTDGDLKPDVNIDTDGTDTWKPSSEGGNADKIWKPYLNIDTFDGQGPVHFDNTDPVDENNDGVDDRWVPKADTKAENGFVYDTLGDNWVNDLKPGETPEEPVDPDDPNKPDDPTNPDDPQKPTPLPSPDDESGQGGSGQAAGNSGKVGPTMSATGDNTMFLVSVLAMAAYTGLAVLFFARRKMNATKKAGKHSL